MGVGTDLVYRALAVAASPVLAARLLTRPSARRYLQRDQRRAFLGHGPALSNDDDHTGTLLIHASSVGEVHATPSMVRELRLREPNLRVVISTMTDTGFDRATAIYGDDLPVVRYPLDLTGAVARFLDRVRPDAVALVELEVWPNFVEACEARGIPLCVVNGRLSAPSFRRYRKIARWIRPSFGRLAQVGAQTEAYAERFEALGVSPDRITITDNLKWDSAPRRDELTGAEALRSAMGIDPERPLVVAGSTGPGEEERLLRARPDDVQLMVAPRKPARFDEVAALDSRWVRRSDPSSKVRASSGLFLLDSMGDLETAYALADVAIVGRSFEPQGGSDPIAPAALGVPTLTGPHHDNFLDVVQALRDGDGIRVTEAPMREALRLLEHPEDAEALAQRGRAVVEARRGATARNVEIIQSVLAETTSPR